MLLTPFPHEREGCAGQVSLDDIEGLDVDLCLEPGVTGVEVRRRVIVPKHLDQHAIEQADRWH